MFAIVVAIALLGHMSEEEKSGRRLYWAEWPLPEAEGIAPEAEIRKAA